MQEYRAYLVSSADNILHRVDFVCRDDEAAKERAKQIVDGYDVELWNGGQKIETFLQKKKESKICFSVGKRADGRANFQLILPHHPLTGQTQ
jgi:hypothetical protein